MFNGIMGISSTVGGQLTKSPAPAPAALSSHAALAAPAADGARPRRGPPSCAGRPGDPRCLGGAPGDHMEKLWKNYGKLGG